MVTRYVAVWRRAPGVLVNRAAGGDTRSRMVPWAATVNNPYPAVVDTADPAALSPDGFLAWPTLGYDPVMSDLILVRNTFADGDYG